MYVYARSKTKIFVPVWKLVAGRLVTPPGYVPPPCPFLPGSCNAFRIKGKGSCCTIALRLRIQGSRWMVALTLLMFKDSGNQLTSRGPWARSLVLAENIWCFSHLFFICGHPLSRQMTVFYFEASVSNLQAFHSINFLPSTWIICVSLSSDLDIQHTLDYKDIAILPQSHNAKFNRVFVGYFGLMLPKDS